MIFILLNQKIIVSNHELPGRVSNDPSLANGCLNKEEIKYQDITAIYTSYRPPEDTVTDIHSLENELDNLHFIHPASQQYRGGEKTQYSNAGDTIEFENFKTESEEEFPACTFVYAYYPGERFVYSKGKIKKVN